MSLQIGYQLLNITVHILLCIIGFKGIKAAYGITSRAKRKKIVLVVILFLWQVYLFALGQTDRHPS